ncbi:hypothetical protein [Dactylosporangium sp. CS-033363]|uniref:hypothetical protein n=1 Tax=Dactylosporangium sp. CS-033363 TaxID=3239935 RepID=UPI003D90605B
MALRRAYEDLAYRPEFGTLVVRDAGPWAEARPRPGMLLGAGSMNLQPSGTFARAGDGWLEARAYGDRFEVRLEAHDGPPPPEDPGLHSGAGWTDVLETPMISGGRVGLSTMTGGPGSDALPLGAGPALYRVRVCVRSHTFVLRFWPVDGPVDPPRRLARAATSPSPGPEEVSDVVMLLLWSHAAGRPLTLDDVAERTLQTPADVRATLERAITRERALASFDPLVFLDADGKRRQAHTIAHSPLPTPPPDDGPEAPPRAGVVVGESVHARTAGKWTVIGHWPGQYPRTALQTRYGTVLTAAGGVALTAPDGRLDLLSPSAGTDCHVDATGTLLALSETRSERHAQVRLINLSTGTDDTMPWPKDQVLQVVGLHNGAVYANTDQGTVAWRPGTAPEPIGGRLRSLDPISGTGLEQGSRLWRPTTGWTHMAMTERTTRLVPGGRSLEHWQGQPPQLYLYEPPESGPSPARVVPLPGADRRFRGPDPYHPSGRVWESPDRVLLLGRSGGLYRFLLSTGQVFRPALPERTTASAIVSPLWT